LNGADQAVSVVTGALFATSPDLAWDGLLLFEQVDGRPPLPLRLLLPDPARAEGRRSRVGDETRCLYRQGHLLKRVTEIERFRRCRFDVIEQQLEIVGGIRLLGGSYTLTALTEQSTRIELETRYVSPRRPRLFWAPIESTVCHAFHRHILAAMRREIELRTALKTLPPVLPEGEGGALP